MAPGSKVVNHYTLDYLVSNLRVSNVMTAVTTSPVWSARAKRIPESLNAQLVGTFPSTVAGSDGAEACAFFIRATREEFSKSKLGRKSKSLIRPQFVATPHGPLVVAYCLASSNLENSEPFMSETALFPRLPSMPSHREIFGMLKSGKDVFFVVCDENGECLLNSKARIRDEWRSEFAEKSKAFDEGKQISDEKTAIMSLYWYQERYNPSSRIFEVKH